MEMLYVAFRTRIQKVYINKTQNITPFVLGDHLAHTLAHRGLSMCRTRLYQARVIYGILVIRKLRSAGLYSTVWYGLYFEQYLDWYIIKRYAYGVILH